MSLSDNDRKRAERIAKHHGYQPSVITMFERFGRFRDQNGGAAVLVSEGGRGTYTPLDEGLRDLFAAQRGRLEEFREGRPVPEEYRAAKTESSPRRESRIGAGSVQELINNPAALERLLFEE